MITVSKTNLSAALGAVAKIAPGNPTLPVLSHVLLSMRDGTLYLSCTDLELSVMAAVGARGDNGEYCVPARVFSDLVGALPDENVTLDIGENEMGVKCGKFSGTVKGIPWQEFPMVIAAKNEPVAVDAEALREMIARVVLAAASDESRPVLTGVLFEFSDGLTMAAADGFRLAVARDKVGGAGTVIIPAKSVLELGRLLDRTIVCRMTLDENRAYFDMEYDDKPTREVALVSQVIVGNFPDYNQIIPKVHSTIVVADTASLLRALKQANIFARMETNQIVLDICDNKMSITAQSAESGQMEIDLSVELDGEAVEASFNVKYLMDALAVVGTPKTLLRFNGANRPLLIQPVGEVDYVHVIMPMQVRRK
jgi:DNA polymerase-3 subunit beta